MITDKPIKVLVVGCGHMGTSHALAYHQSAEFEIVGLVSRGESSRARLAEALGGYPTFDNFSTALTETHPDAVCVCTYPDTHALYASEALEAGCHVFLEKPLGLTVKEAEELVALSVKVDRRLLVGYILQYHPAWMRFVDEAQNLGKPLVMRMNLNQQSSGSEWESHKNIMQSMSPMVDCGVHYIDVMCRMTQAKPVRVHGITARCSEELPEGMYNYGQLQVGFDDGSVGWYEAGWGPMMSKVAFFVKDVVGPNGCVSIVADTSTLKDSADVNAHTKTDSLLVHHASLDQTGQFSKSDTTIATGDEPDHDALCALEQAFFARAISGNLDLTAHLDSAVLSLKVVLAAEQSAKSGQVVDL